MNTVDHINNLPCYKHNRRKRRPTSTITFASCTRMTYQICKSLLATCTMNTQKTLSSCNLMSTPVALLGFYLILSTLVPTLHAQTLIQPQSTYLQPGSNMDNLRISELKHVGSIVYRLNAFDKSNETRKFTYMVSGETFSVNEETGEVRLMKPLDREHEPTIRIVVNVLGGNSEEPLESRVRMIVVEDADDSWPIFSNHTSSLINNPQQGQFVYQVEISERAPPGSIVMNELLVTDADEGPNAEIVFECRQRKSSNRACDYFTIEPKLLKTGRYSLTLRTKQNLDYESDQSFKFSLIARGKQPSPLNGVPLESEAVININVLNVQDEGPSFVNAPYSLSMPEGLEVGVRLLRLIVQDGDFAPQRDLNVIVCDGPFKRYFSIEKDQESSKIWYLTTNNTLDREDARISAARNMININLIAVELDDSGVPVASDSELFAGINMQNYNKALIRRESVSIVVVDKPDSTPVFVSSSSRRPVENNHLVLNISELLSVGSSVPNLDLTVLDLDQGANSRFNLTLVDGSVGPSASEVFALDSEIIHGKSEVVLNVLNSSLLDYENPSRRVYRFWLRASKSDGNVQLEQNLDVQFNVVDANDNWPEFDRDQYIVSVPEGSPPGYLVATIKALDRDSGSFGHVSHILMGHGSSKFAVISSEGKIVVGDCALLQCLDYEVQPSFSLTYSARDGGGRTRNVSVIINVLDINDHVPKFSEIVYKRELISDNLSSKQNYISPQLIVRARDDDGPLNGRNNITYRIRSSNLTGLEVEPNSGLVYMSQPLDLDKIVSDRVYQQQTTSGNTLSAYHQRKIIFEAEVMANDNGVPPLNATALIHLVVKGNRDGAPQFKQDIYQAYVPENQPAFKPFFQVQAVDPDDKDSQLRYSLSYDPNDLISIEERSGQLSFKTRIDYDEFKGAPYNITVYSTDNSRPSPLRASAIVSVLVQDVNNKRPKFTDREYKTTLAQGRTKLGDVVLQVKANDSDLNARLNYTLIAEKLSINDRNGQQFSLEDVANASGGYLAQMSHDNRQKLASELKRMFAINQRTGAIELKVEPDYSFAASITVQVRVVDLNQEVFMQTGELQEDFAQCVFFLEAHVDKRPIFAAPWTLERREYNISVLEELPIGTPIFSLLAKDQQTNQRINTFEKIYESDPRDYFRVERSGQVLTNRRIDFEELPAQRLGLSVKALNNDAQFSIAHINVQVVDLNDNAPQFHNQSYQVQVSESLQSLQEILTVGASDKDSSEHNQVFYSLNGFSSDLFQIHPRKGVITLKRGAKLDRDTEAQHHLVAIASDCNETVSRSELSLNSIQTIADGVANNGRSTPGCKRSSVSVEITLLDENDNDPVFIGANKRGEFEAVTSETVSPGSVLTQVAAKDIDEGLNGQITYEIVQTDERLTRLFKIDSDGYITATASLSGLGRTTPYRVTIRAFDSGPKQSRQSYATLLLTISDVVENDGVPKFVRPKPDEQITLPESAGPSTFVYQVQAVDLDEEANGKLMYKFNQPSDTFEIDPFDGVIKTQHKPNFYLDRELVPNYTLIVVAQDLGSSPKQAHLVLNIKITDMNDNEPYFEREVDDPPLVLYVEEEMPKDSLIGTVQAIDKDIGSNALIGYEIIEGNRDNLFRLSWNSANDQTNAESQATEDETLSQGNNPCRIYSTGRLDRDTRETYTLTIKATSMSKMRNQLLTLRDPLGGRNPFNQYNASDLTKIRVVIKLTDINDNRPIFVQPNAKSVVDSSAEVYSQLMVVRAVDVDSSSSGIQYSVLEALYFSDSKFRPQERAGSRFDRNDQTSFTSMKYVFDIDSRSGILRNAVSLRPFTDGYFEVFIKADSGSNSGGHLSEPIPFSSPSRRFQDGKSTIDRCSESTSNNSMSSANLPMGLEVTENCFVAVTKVTIFITHQRETFRFVFNKTRLNDRLDEFRDKIQHALEDIMFEPAKMQASLADPKAAKTSLQQDSDPIVAERVYLNTFNTDFYERDDGSLDFSTITSCSQLVKFDDRYSTIRQNQDDITLVPNQVVSYEDVVNLLKTLNATQASRLTQQQTPTQQPKPSNLFSQYGLVKIERCLPDKTMYKMTFAERLALYFASMIALISIVLAFIVSKMRKNYERNLKILQRSKYQYMGSPYC